MPNKSLILVHGLFMNKAVMLYMSKQFSKMGYKVHIFGYTTTRYSESTLKDLVKLIKSIPHEDSLYLIGHSMGGLIIRNTFQKYYNKLNFPFKDIAIVTIGTPHYGSHLGTFLHNSFIKKIFGSSGQAGILKHVILDPWNININIGCIAGTHHLGLNHIFSKYIFNKTKLNTKSDGTVFVEEAILENCTDSIIIKGHHTGLIYSKEVVQLCDNFFKNQKFQISFNDFKVSS